MDLKDSGEREQFTTGSQRDTRAGKGRFDLIPPGPLYRIARIYEDGAIKYDDNNWRKGQPLSRYVDSAERHLKKWRAAEHDEDHLAQACWNVIALMWTEAAIKAGLLPKELSDIPVEPPPYGDGFQPAIHPVFRMEGNQVEVPVFDKQIPKRHFSAADLATIERINTSLRARED